MKSTGSRYVLRRHKKRQRRIRPMRRRKRSNPTKQKLKLIRNLKRRRNQRRGPHLGRVVPLTTSPPPARARGIKNRLSPRSWTTQTWCRLSWVAIKRTQWSSRMRRWAWEKPMRLRAQRSGNTNIGWRSSESSERPLHGLLPHLHLTQRNERNGNL